MESEQRDIHSNSIRKLRLKIAFFLAIRYELFFLTVAGFLLGVVMLVVRVAFVIPRHTLLWALPCLVPGAALAIIRAIGKTPSQKVLRAVFDHENHCGGLLMAADEVDLGPWRQEIPPLRSPALIWHGARSFCLFTGAALFVAVGFVIPQRYVNMAASRHLNISEDIAKLAEQVDTLEKEEIISPEKAQEFGEKLEHLRDTASAYDPVKTWEALDDLQNNVRKAADQLAASSLSQMENLTQTQTLAEGLSDEAAALDPRLLSEAKSELSAMAQANALQSESFKNSLGADCLNACKQGSLSAEQVRELLKTLKESKADIANRLARLSEAQLVDPDTLKSCEKLGTCNSKGLAAFLNGNSGSMGIRDAVSSYSQRAGQGGVNRGRGDAPMTWSEGSREENIAFKEQALPPASLAALKESMTVGVSTAAPSIEERMLSPKAGGLNSARAGSGEALSHTILPRHKGVVKRYFERE